MDRSNSGSHPLGFLTGKTREEHPAYSKTAPVVLPHHRRLKQWILGTFKFYACLSMYDDLDSLSHLLFSPLTLCGPHDATDQLVIMEKTDDLLSV